MLPYCLNGTNVPDFITRQTYVVITCIWRDMGYVAFRHFCRESGFVANTRFFGCILSRLLLRHRGFYSDFVQISVQNIGDWDLCWLVRIQPVIICLYIKMQTQVRFVEKLAQLNATEHR